MSQHTRTPWFSVLALIAAACAPEAPRPVEQPSTPTPAEVAGELLEADRGYSTAATDTDLVSALTAMFDERVIMPTPAGTFAEGVLATTAALEVDTLNRASHVRWVPIRAGVSADGLHGFTFGYMTVSRPDSTQMPLKYLAYWVKRADGWRVAAYKRGRSLEAVEATPMPPALPEGVVAPVSDAATLARHAQSLTAAERGFSDEAQVIGLGPAFAKWGSADAVNMGGPSPTWILGAEVIARGFGPEGAEPSSISWGADRVLVASSGDLGVTFGTIRPNDPADGPTEGVPFFTIWRKASPGARWLYVAE